jgi:hypothetical protein
LVKVSSHLLVFHLAIVIAANGMIPALWTFTDLTFVLLPVIVIWRLQMAIRQRIGIVLLMSMSLLTMTMSILKTISLSRIAAQQSDPTATDVQYSATLTILYTCLEQAFVIIMGCVPPLRSASRLPIARSISSSLGSVLRNMKSSMSMDSSKYGGRDVPYEELDLENDRRGQTAKFHTAAVICEERRMGHAGVDNFRPTGIHA